MIDYNPARDRWESRCLELSARMTRIVDVLTRKAMLPPPEDCGGTFACPYCYRDTPHSAVYHDQIAADFEMEADETGGVLDERQREFLRFIAGQCREHGTPAERKFDEASWQEELSQPPVERSNENG